MRHGVRGRKLGRLDAHRKAMFRNQLASLFLHDRIKTTITKAKELRPLAEKLVTLAKRDGSPADKLHARRQAEARVLSSDAVKRLFSNIAPRFKERPGGYTRILRLGQMRKGDNAEMALLEFVDFVFKEKEKAEPAKGARKKGEESDETPKPDKKAKAAPKKPAKGGDEGKAGKKPEKKAAAPKKEKADDAGGKKAKAPAKKKKES